MVTKCTRSQKLIILLYGKFRRWVLRSKEIRSPLTLSSTHFKPRGRTYDSYSSSILEHLWDKFEIHVNTIDPMILKIMDQLTGFKEYDNFKEDKIKDMLKIVGSIFKAIDLPSVLREHAPQ